MFCVDLCFMINEKKKNLINYMKPENTNLKRLAQVYITPTRFGHLRPHYRPYAYAWVFGYKVNVNRFL